MVANIAGTYHYEYQHGIRTRVANLPANAAQPAAPVAMSRFRAADLFEVPPGARWIKVSPTDPTSFNVIFELPPALRELQLERTTLGKDYYYRTVKEQFTVALPWTYILVGIYRDHFSYAKAFWAKTRAQSIQTTVAGAVLPNVYRGNECLICVGSTLGDHARTLTGLAVAEAFAKRFYITTFNNHATGLLDHPRDYTSWKEWEDASKADPLVYLNWHFWGRAKKYDLFKAISARFGY